MRRTHVSSDISKIMKRARGRYGVALGQLVQSHKIDMPLVGLKSIPSPLFCEDKNILPLEYSEVVTLLEPITRLKRSVADIVGLNDKITYMSPRRRDKEIPVSTADYGWLMHNEECENYEYILHVNADSQVYKEAICFIAAIRYVNDVEYITTRRGDVYICCSINKVRKEAVKMGRVDSRGIELYDPEQEVQMAAKYFQDELLKTAERLNYGNGKLSDRWF